MAFNRTTGRSVNLKCNLNVNMQDMRKMCAKCVQDMCKLCARSAQDVCKMYAYVMFDIIRKYSTCWILKKCEEPCRILKKFVHACVGNVIHAKVLPGSVLSTLNESESEV